MGAILYGGTDKDVLSLNDITLWTGEPDRKVTTPDAYKAIPEIRALLDKEDYRGADRAQRKVQGHYSENYQPLGQLSITYSAEPAKVSHYQRTLDISRAMARTAYQRNGKDFACDYLLQPRLGDCTAPADGKCTRAASHSFVQLASAARHYGQRQ